MKYLTFVFISISLFSCGQPSEEPKGTHKHEDGTVHESHKEAEHHQEEFKVGSDSSAVKSEQGHSHEDGHKH